MRTILPVNPEKLRKSREKKMSKIRHVLGISGGKDSAALAIYLRSNYPQLDIEYYFADTGKELAETYQFIDSIESFLGKPIIRLRAIAENSPQDPFDYFLAMYGGYLPSPRARWCTRNLKLDPFERYVGDDPVISYVAIRGDEDREGYVSQKSNIQTIFPFRRNIWSQEIINLILNNEHIDLLSALYAEQATPEKREAMLEIAHMPLSPKFTQSQKLQALFDLSIATFNQVAFAFLKTSTYPIARLADYPLLSNEESIDRTQVFRLLDESGVGRPPYHQFIEFEVDGQKGKYHRSRSGCYFCFFQQKIEWIWLYEQHPDLFLKAMEYEKAGFSWMEDDRLEDLIEPERMEEIKREHLAKTCQAGAKKPSSRKLMDVLLNDSEGEGCTACFV
jgi:3'-phosphoadenosine 5'-phosphosulfate sulfotransferase (PAPS reductase)/FAD synthetase